MTMRQVLDTLKPALEDPATGLTAMADALIAAGEPAVPTAVSVGKWAFKKMRDTRAHAVVVAPARGADQTKMLQTLHRDGTQQVAVSVEVFGADEEAVQDTITLLQVALLMVLDGLVDYSVAHGPAGHRIIEVLDPVDTAYGEFEGTVPASGTAAGFTTRFNVNERSAQ